MIPPILEVANYTLDYRTRAGTVRVLDDITLQIAPGEVLGLVGESGSGKSSFAWAVMRALPRNAIETGGPIALEGRDLRMLGEKAMAAIRGRRIGMVFQDPSASLNPTLTLGRQVTETLRRHRGLDAKDAREAALAALGHVGLRNPAALLKRYPHQVSGGEKQRVMLATAFAARPDLIVFDEPTTALDVITGARILDLFAQLRAETGVAALYISHDLALVARVSDRVAVLDRGRIVEQAPARHIFAAPASAYTRRLVAAVPRPDHPLPIGKPTLETLLELDGLSVTYARRRLFGPVPAPNARDVSFSLHGGEILGVVGESGSGKSTIARAIAGIVPFSGGLRHEGRVLTGPADMGLDYRRAVQIIFQHPDGSLNPRHRIGTLLARPLRLYGGDAAAIPRLLEQVRLPASYADRYPHQLSGGEKQRVAIARAFAAKPSLVICDEITAPLDVSVQASVVELLLELHRAHGTAYLFITHDLNLVRQIAHRLVVMQHGSLVDLQDTTAIAAGAGAAYTRALIDASPLPVGKNDDER
jgi:peptide/nickel transport system ATP-binding protein